MYSFAVQHFITYNHLRIAVDRVLVATVVVDDDEDAGVSPIRMGVLDMFEERAVLVEGLATALVNVLRLHTVRLAVLYPLVSRQVVFPEERLNGEWE